MSSGRACNGTAAPISDEDEDDDWQAGTRAIIIEKETKKRKKRTNVKKQVNPSSSLKRARNDEGMEFDLSGDISGSEQAESEIDCDMRTSTHISFN